MGDDKFLIRADDRNDVLCTSSRRWTRAILSPRNSLRATKAPDWDLVTSLAGTGGNEGDSKRGVAGGSVGVMEGREWIVGGKREDSGVSVPAGRDEEGSEATEATEAGGGIEPSESAVR